MNLTHGGGGGGGTSRRGGGCVATGCSRCHCSPHRLFQRRLRRRAYPRFGVCLCCLPRHGCLALIVQARCAVIWTGCRSLPRGRRLSDHATQTIQSRVVRLRRKNKPSRTPWRQTRDVPTQRRLQHGNIIKLMCLRCNRGEEWTSNCFVDHMCKWHLARMLRPAIPVAAVLPQWAVQQRRWSAGAPAADRWLRMQTKGPFRPHQP